MNARERIDTAIRLGRPDRVPVVPMIDSFAARYAGVTQHDMLFSIRRSDRAFLRVHRELGPIDGFNYSNAGLARLMDSLSIVPPIWPGVNGVDDNALWQFVEKTVIKPEEYAALAARPGAFMRDKAIELRSDLEGLRDFYIYKALGFYDGFKVMLSCRAWRLRGIEPMVGANNVLFPLEQISTQLRSYSDFVTDLYRHGDDLKRAAHALLRTWFPLCLAGPYVSGVRRALIGLTRTSATLMSPRQFEEFALPDLLELCGYLHQARHHPRAAHGQRLDRLLPLLQAAAPGQVRPQPGRTAPTSSPPRRCWATTCASWGTCRPPCSSCRNRKRWRLTARS